MRRNAGEQNRRVAKSWKRRQLQSRGVGVQVLQTPFEPSKQDLVKQQRKEGLKGWNLELV